LNANTLNCGVQNCGVLDPTIDLGPHNLLEDPTIKVLYLERTPQLIHFKTIYIYIYIYSKYINCGVLSVRPELGGPCPKTIYIPIITDAIASKNIYDFIQNFSVLNIEWFLKKSQKSFKYETQLWGHRTPQFLYTKVGTSVVTSGIRAATWC